MLYINNLGFFINNKTIFEHLSFKVFNGNLLHICGDNGSGKTTLLKIISGLFESEIGKIIWNGEDIFKIYKKYVNDILFIGHKKNLHLLLTPLENILYQMSLIFDRNLIDIKVVLKIMGLDNFINIRCLELSEGQRQRVVLSRLLVQKSRLWILDEPFSYIDYNGIVLLNNIIFNFIYSGGIIIIVDHHNYIKKFEGYKKLNIMDYK